ncbi:Multidrug efflux pump subunit AcrA (membrane-fusion protein) [Pseudooceanicola antarcticus]|nr:HlyD family efflux transporter periplasmic adaptor subunit [Pseudooceanicola antarcticus]SNY54982.1 Multidrug efflux pump subunit AcrA (membrane-fusion protein) [Pseudooceanicola antarcticus]
MTAPLTMPLFERALRRHLAVLPGLKGVQAFLGEAGDWTEAARLGDLPMQVHRRVLAGFDPDAGGSVEAMGEGQDGWLATYMVGGPGLDLVLILRLAGISPGDLQTTLNAIEARTGWLLVAALKDREEAGESRALGGAVGAQVLIEAARARNRRLLADQWIARLEGSFQPALTGVCWLRADTPTLAAISGGGGIERPSDARQAMEGLAALALRHRTPMLTAPAETLAPEGLTEDPGREDPLTARLLDEAQVLVERLGGARGLILPVWQGDKAGAVVILIFAEGEGQGLRAEGAETLSGLLGEALTIQARAHPAPLRRLGNFITGLVVGLFGKTAWKLKLALLLLAAAATAAAFIPTEVAPSFTARVEARERQVVSAPFDGFLARAPYQLGDRVEPGALLVSMEDADLRLRLNQIRARLAEIDSEAATARAQRDTAQVRLLEAQRQQSEVDLGLTERQLELASFTAPSEAVVVGGDAWRRVGDRVRLGEPLMELATSGAFRVLAFVDEDWISDLPVGTPGTMLLTAYPDQPLEVTLAAMGGRPEMREGVNSFPVWLDFTEATPDANLLDGMRGVARLELGETSALKAWTRGAARWFRRTLWRWS